MDRFISSYGVRYYIVQVSYLSIVECWSAGLAEHYEAVVVVVGAAVVDVGGVGVGGGGVVALDGGGEAFAVAEGPVDELVGVVALLEFEALDVGAVVGVPLHAALLVEAPVGECADDIDAAAEVGALHGE